MLEKRWNSWNVIIGQGDLETSPQSFTVSFSGQAKQSLELEESSFHQCNGNLQRWQRGDSQQANKSFYCKGREGVILEKERSDNYEHTFIFLIDSVSLQNSTAGRDKDNYSEYLLATTPWLDFVELISLKA